MRELYLTWAYLVSLKYWLVLRCFKAAVKTRTQIDVMMSHRAEYCNLTRVLVSVSPLVDISIEDILRVVHGAVDVSCRVFVDDAWRAAFTVRFVSFIRR